MELELEEEGEGEEGEEELGEHGLHGQYDGRDENCRGPIPMLAAKK